MEEDETLHTIYYDRALKIEDLGKESVDLVVTSPPYPMISMWDSLFSYLNPEIRAQLESGNGWYAFDLMHTELDRVWKSLFRLVKDGGLVCINIGDATRKIGENFTLYSSHSRITELFLLHGFQALPGIIWRKTTNSPNKFMGSGMLPSGAYVTLEHEHILIFRKNGKRTFPEDKDKNRRRKSSYFWEERNRWFSDIWQDLKGVRQTLNTDKSRERSAAFPLDVPYRLINMFSVKGDTVLDPFLGTATTTIAAIMSQRNSIGYEMDTNLAGMIDSRIMNSRQDSNEYTIDRLIRHRDFVETELSEGKQFKYFNENLGFPVKEKSEKFMEMSLIDSVSSDAERRNYTVTYRKIKPPHPGNP